MRKKINIAKHLFSEMDPETCKIHTHKNKFRIENGDNLKIQHIYEKIVRYGWLMIWMAIILKTSLKHLEDIIKQNRINDNRNCRSK